MRGTFRVLGVEFHVEDVGSFDRLGIDDDASAIDDHAIMSFTAADNVS